MGSRAGLDVFAGREVCRAAPGFEARIVELALNKRLQKTRKTLRLNWTITTIKLHDGRFCKQN